MVTNANEYNGKTPRRIICFILCIITFLSSMALGTLGVRTDTYKGYSLNGDDINTPQSYMETYLFKNRLLEDFDNVLLCVSSSASADYIKKELEAQKDDIVEKAYKNYLNQEQYIENNYFGYNDGYYDNDNEYTTSIDNGSNEYQTYYVFLTDGSDYEFTLNNLEIYENHLYNNTQPKSSIEAEYNNFIEDTVCNIYSDCYSHAQYEDSICFYARCNDEVYGNATLTKATVKNTSEYFIYENGKAEYEGIPDEIANALSSSIAEYENLSDNTSIMIQLLPLPSMSTSITNYRYWNDYYVSLAKFHDIACDVCYRIPLIIACAILLLVISFVLAFRLFKTSGKTIFIDRLPVEIHLAITIILGILWCCSWFEINKYLATEFSVVFCITFAVGLTALQVLMLEFCTSVARLKHSNKNMKDCFITRTAARKIKTGFKCIVEYLSYKPQAMGRNAIILTVLYFVLNAIMLGIIICMWLTFEFWILVGIILLVIDIAVNILIVVKVIVYLKKLDEIITSFSSKEDLTLEIDKLPNSLKMLAESMKYTNDELQQAVEKAVKDERLRSELITNVSHDLKTPLTSIITYVDLLSKCDIEDEKAKEYISVLDDKGAKLKRLIEDLIEASKVTSGNVSVNLTKINLSELCLQSTVDAQSDFEKAELELIVKSNENPPIVTADGAKTFRIIENLLSNARKYSARGSRVYVEVYESNGFGIFEIKNISAQPLDISPDELTERFVRGDKSRNQEGNGLGLSIAKELCRLQNGELELIIDGDLFKARVRLPK